MSQIWQMLDYLADDYRGAVADGQIVSDSEYAEMREFAKTVRMQLHNLPAVPAAPRLEKAAERLARSIADKDSADAVAMQAHALADALLIAYPIPTAPLTPPDLKRGAQIYATTCAGCHGADGHGDGPAGARLQPRPVDFTDRKRAAHRSVLSLYEAVTHGVAGTLRWRPFHSLALRIDGLSRSMPAASRTRPMPARGKRDGGKTLRCVHTYPISELWSAGREDQWATLFGADGGAAALGYLRTHPEVLATGPRGIALARGRNWPRVIAAYQQWSRGRCRTIGFVGISRRNRADRADFDCPQR